MGPVKLTPKDAATIKLLKSWGFKYPRTTIGAARASGLPLSYALATLRMETTTGANVFGHDATRSIPDRWKGKRVTRLRYAYYKRRRFQHGAQGVGPGQLTYPGYQDMADKEGGCWRAYPSMYIAFKVMKGLIDSSGRQNGAARYNGTGPEAEAYGRAWAGYQRQFHTILVQHHVS